MTYEEITDKLRSTDWYMCHEVPSVASNNAADALSFIEEQAARIATLEKELDESHALAREYQRQRNGNFDRANVSQARLSEAVKVLESIERVCEEGWHSREMLMSQNPINAVAYAVKGLAKAFIATLGENKP